MRAQAALFWIVPRLTPRVYRGSDLALSLQPSTYLKYQVHQASLLQAVWAWTARKNRSVHLVREDLFAALTLRAALKGVQNTRVFC
ncbi:hypothetical protein RTE01_31340 [Raoultella terrigena]|nr:hypothetical protein RTE01_31340 [Raoultella terrigena]